MYGLDGTARGNKLPSPHNQYLNTMWANFLSWSMAIRHTVWEKPDELPYYYLPVTVRLRELRPQVLFQQMDLVSLPPESKVITKNLQFATWEENI